MPSQVVTRRDAIRYAAGRVAITVSLTATVTSVAVIAHLGADPSVTVPVGMVTASAIMVSVVVSTLLSGALSYRSALLLQQLTKAQAELLRVSRTDPLTGLLNRRGFDEAAVAVLQQARQANREVVALMGDIDHFKSVNDHFGHEFGDRVLCEIGGVLQRFAASHGALVARHGGEEFAALFVGVSAAQAVQYAETLRELCRTEVRLGAATAPITLSIGLTSHIGETELSSIMRWADRALYQAKERGRDRVVQVEATRTVAA
uniref:diguanylate cyclase n=1 Tax=Rhodopseudomonas palustris (strain BisA53) TaxID=316055 RepID=Q07K06_RHOP5